MFVWGRKENGGFIYTKDKLEGIHSIIDDNSKFDTFMGFMSKWMERVEEHISECESVHSDFEGRGFGHYEY